MEITIKNTRLLTSNTLKVIAITAMFVDHMSTWLVPKGTMLDILLHTFGRLAAPIMCFLIAEGYFYTSNVKRYIQRLFVFALISHLPFVMFFGVEWWQATSVIWSLLMGLVALSACKNSNLSLFRKISIVILCCLFAWTANWNYIAVLWIVSFGLFRDQLRNQIISFAAIGIILYAIPGIIDYGWTSIYRFGVLLAIPLLTLYSGEVGKKSNIIKWGFYIFYPLHLIILYILKDLILV